MTIIRNSLSEEVARRLQTQIGEAKYAVGDKLPAEPALMQEFGVGRSSIREAVRLLVNSGLVRVQQGVGTFVLAQLPAAEPLAKRLQRETTPDLREVRQLLETKIVEKAAQQRTDEDIATMRQRLAERQAAVRSQQPQAAIEADLRFHSSVAEACKNPLLTELYQTFIEHQLKQAFTLTFRDTSSLARSIDLHEALLVSIIAQDAEQAVALTIQIQDNAS
jgi:DNA-binding FadR family transcriptional regulator